MSHLSITLKYALKNHNSQFFAEKKTELISVI